MKDDLDVKASILFWEQSKFNNNKIFIILREFSPDITEETESLRK